MNNNIIHIQKRKDNIMCKVLEKIYNKSAEELLKEYDVYDKIPIDLEKLSESIGISVMPADFTVLENKLGKKDILGLVLIDGPDAAIFYNKTSSANRIRFTIAHELAHCCHSDPLNTKSHIEYRIDEEKKDDFEKQMDIFAGELLIPFKKLKEVYLSLDIPSSILLAKKFQVSNNVMEERLKYLKISHYNSNGEAIRYQ